MNKNYNPTQEDIDKLKEIIETKLQEEHHKDNKMKIWRMRK